MNTTAKILIGAVVVAGVAAFYLSRQGAPVGTAINSDANNNLAPSTLPSEGAPVTGVLGQGTRPWAVMFDEKGELSSRFRADRYDPHENSTFEVTAPEFEYFRPGGGITRLVGKTGRVYIPAGSSASSSKGGFGMKGQSMPSRGILKDVTMYIYDAPPPDAPPSARGPEVLAARMDNVSFDYDTLRIATEASVIDGRQVAADKIPVVVRGKDFDFDGQGLTVRINQRDREIQSLDIAHGGLIVIKSADLVSLKDPKKSPASKPATAAAPIPAPSVESSPQPAPSAQTSQTPADQAAAPVAKPVYRVTLTNNVHVVQGKDTEVAGDIMQIDFRDISKSLKEKSASPSANTKPSNAPANAANSNNPTSTPATNTDAPPPPATTTPNEQGVEPMIVTWDGPLNLVLGDGDPRTPERNAIATITGKAGVPVLLRNRQSEARAPVAIFETATRYATLRGDDKAPVLLTDARGSTVTTPLLTFDYEGLTARLKGNTTMRGNADADSGGGPGQTFQASWTGEGILHFARQERPAKADRTAKADGDSETMRIDTANLSGDVKIDHPQLKLTADTLDLAFDPSTKQLTPKNNPAKPAAKPADTDMMASGKLRDVQAKGHVKAEMLDDGTGKNKPGSLNADALQVAFTIDPATGKSNPSKVIATGNVEGASDGSILNSDSLVVELAQIASQAPAQPGAARRIRSDWSTLTATGNVRATTNDNSKIKTPLLKARNVGNKQREIWLEGPGTQVISSDATVVTTDQVHFLESENRAELPLPGTIQGVAAAKAGEKPAPFTASWKGRADLNLRDNTLDVVDKVQFQSVAADGTRFSASGDKMHVTLEDKPSPTQSVVDPVNAAAPKRPRTSDLTGSKQLSTMELTGTVRLSSELFASDGSLLRRFYLESERIISNKNRDFEVPVPGRLLLQDNAKEDKPAEQNASTNLSRRGITAIAWKKSLLYQPALDNLTFLGDVQFAHQPTDTRLDPKGQPEAPYQLSADRLDAKFVSKDKAAAAAGSGLPGSQEKFESVTATGKITFSGRGMTVYANDLLYDPRGKLVTAKGSPVIVEQASNAGTATFDRARINLTTGMIEDLTNPTGSIGNLNPALPNSKQPPAPQQPQPSLPNRKDRELRSTP